MDVKQREGVLSALRDAVKPEVYDVWCKSLTFEETDGGWTVPTANLFHRELMDRELRAPLEEAFKRVYGVVPRVVFVVREDFRPPAETPAAPRVEAPVNPRLRLNETYTLDKFVVGPSNRMAHAAALSVAEGGRSIYNPLFIHGSVGLGKTHLLQGVCRRLLDRNPHLKIVFASCEAFVNDYITAVRKNGLDGFRARVRDLDVLILDDIHFLAGKEGSQEEFFHTYNALHGFGKQVILSSDARPEDIPTLQKQLVSRFKSGLVAMIDTPTFEMRAAILSMKAKDRGWDLPDDVLHYLAGAIQSNIRELEGAVTKVIGYASVTGRAIDLELAREVTRDLLEIRVSPISVTDIQKRVAQYFKIDVAEMRARRWKKSTSLPRQLAMYLARAHTGHSLKEIGGLFGGKDHATVVYAVQRVERLRDKHGEVRAHLDALTRLLNRQC